MQPVIEVRDLKKEFVLHTQGGVRIPVFSGLDLTVHQGECVALYGPSGAGKSTLLRCMYANYKPQQGQVLIHHQDGVVDLVTAEPRKILKLRKTVIGYVSQFLRVIPRVSALDVVAEPMIAAGLDSGAASEKAAGLLDRLRIPERLWSVAPATFSGGEQQRVNIARAFVVDYPVMLLDEPTASLDMDNRRTVVEIILEAKARGTCMVGIFHDDEVREEVTDRLLDMSGNSSSGERSKSLVA